MGLWDQITGTRGGHEPVERLARGEADCDDPRSPAFEHWHAPVGAAPPEADPDAMARAAPGSAGVLRAHHPRVRGTDPLGALGQGALGTLASRLLGSLTGGAGRRR